MKNNLYIALLCISTSMHACFDTSLNSKDLIIENSEVKIESLDATSNLESISSEILSHLGFPFVDKIKKAKEITILKIDTKESKIKKLTCQEVDGLKISLLDKDNYNFDLAKFNVFIPEFIIIVYGENSEDLFFLNMDSLQIKCRVNNKWKVLEMNKKFQTNKISNLFSF